MVGFIGESKYCGLIPKAFLLFLASKIVHSLQDLEDILKVWVICYGSVSLVPLELVAELYLGHGAQNRDGCSLLKEVVLTFEHSFQG